ncbi:MAG: Holliday junction branch migration protein RuvA [Flavobacteriales bacterium]|nr:Holliday junction branch migration protein RuvA [Flavobacteriales bacterium]
MIAYLKGRLAEKNPTDVVIECNGVGYQVNISLNTYSQISDSEQVQLYTHLAIREDAHTLYGFYNKSEKNLFLQLISVSGVGANTARMILSAQSVSDIQQAIINEDVNTLKRIKGIGAKSAQRIIVDLKDKVALDEGADNISSAPHNRVADEALSALVALGFNRGAVRKILNKMDLKDHVETESIIKEALKFL